MPIFHHILRTHIIDTKILQIWLFVLVFNFDFTLLKQVIMNTFLLFFLTLFDLHDLLRTRIDRGHETKFLNLFMLFKTNLFSNILKFSFLVPSLPVQSIKHAFIWFIFKQMCLFDIGMKSALSKCLSCHLLFMSIR